jgi:FkbM family methyltransferase
MSGTTTGAYQTDLIYDLGMHVALDTKFYLDKGFRVVSLEANPALCDAAAKTHAGAIASGHLTIVDRALWYGSDETISFYLNPTKEDWSSAFKGWAEKGGHASQEISVKTITLSRMFDLYGVPYFIKCDIEGADQLFVQQLLADSRRPAFVSIEAISLEALALLYAAGYDRVQIVNQAFNGFVTPPNPSREGKFAHVQFNGHMSGLFGRELAPEGWQTFSVASEDYLAFRKLHDRNELLAHGWLDFHVASSATLKQLGVLE